MKIITVNINKGGVGKSTISYNLGKFLSGVQKKKTLLIDGDRSQNLSFSFSDLVDESIYDVFAGGEVKFTKISDTLDVLKGSAYLEDKKLDLKSRQNNIMIMYMWIADNIERLEKYDYIIIDTHNDDSLVTANFLAVADLVLAVTEPSRNGLRAWHELVNWIEDLKKQVVDPISRTSYINCNYKLIANQVKESVNSHKEFLEAVESEELYLGMIQDKNLMNKSLSYNTSIFEMKEHMRPSEYKNHATFYDNIESLFEKVVDF